jgi:hypothetical protein
VLDIVENKPESGQRHAATALRLDRKCFSAALAKSMLLSNEGDEPAAARIRALALNGRITPDGPTLAQAMVALSARMPGRS